jgi:hypothetical protein
VPVVGDALDVEQLQHLGLEGIRPYLQSGEGKGDSIALLLSGCFREGTVESITISIWVETFERGVIPIGFKGCRELLHQLGSCDFGEPDVPFDAVQHGGMGEVRGTHVGGVEPRVACKAPGLCVQTGTHGVVLDLDLGPKISDKAIQSTPLSCTHVGSRDDSQQGATSLKVDQLRLDDSQPVPLDEGAKQIDLIGTVQFRLHLVA